tara:strand:+ start:6039 stop:7559 length:1521 start_codon:yes stop_codon:yes gene_type:complete
MTTAIRSVTLGIVPETRVVDTLYQTDPMAWIVDRMRIPEGTLRWSLNPGYAEHEWDGTEDPFVEILEAVGACKWVGCESATGTGKTYASALLALWFMDVFEGGRVITLAPTRNLLSLNLWKEVSSLWPTFSRYNPRAQLLSLEMRMDPLKPKEWNMVGFSAGVGGAEKSAGKARGFHAEHQLFIFEEMTGIHPAIIEAAENTLTGGPRNQAVGFGNPDNEGDPLHLWCERPEIESFRISAYDHPNVVMDDHRFIPGAVTQASIDRRLAKVKGDDTDQLFMSMIRGICPTDTEFGLIKRKWIREAQVRAAEMGEELRAGPKARGVDVADSEDGDKGAIAEGKGEMLESVIAFPCPDANLLAMQVVTECRADGIEAARVGVDSVGVGAGTINEMKRLRFYAKALHGGAGPVHEEEEERFLNLRAQMWWQLRRDLMAGVIGIAFDDEDLFRELLSVRFSTTSVGKLKIESKTEIKKRLGRSPDRADAVVYWNWIRIRRGGAEVLIGRAS